MRKRFLLALLMLACSVAPAARAERVALLIGHASYQNAALRNPANDAAGVSTKLKSLGVQVVSRTKLDRDKMFRKVQEFRSALKPGGVGVFLYSGHGVEVAGRNFLPVAPPSNA